MEIGTTNSGSLMNCRDYLWGLLMGALAQRARLTLLQPCCGDLDAEAATNQRHQCWHHSAKERCAALSA